jgi:hypothetical protein
LRNENPGNHHIKGVQTLKGFANLGTLSGFKASLFFDPRVVADAPTLGSN